MNKRTLILSTSILLVTMLATACGGFQKTQPPTALPPVRLTAPPTFPPTVAPSAIASATPLMATPTPDDPARKTVEDFFAALDEKDYEAAAALYSNFSLMVDEVTRGEAAEALKADALKGSGPQQGVVFERFPFDERTVLVRVRYYRIEAGNDTPTGTSVQAQTPAPTLSARSATQTREAELWLASTALATTLANATPTLASGSVDQTRQAQMLAEQTATVEAASAAVTPTLADVSATQHPGVEVNKLWAVRQESGQWRINRSNIIDFKTLDVPAQYTGGLTVKPRQLTRYSDHLRLTLLVQNQTGDLIVLGQPNEVMATFLFGDEKIEAEQNRLIFEGRHSYPDAAIDLKGLYETYPDGVIIRQWKNVQVDPWFVFELK